MGALADELRGGLEEVLEKEELRYYTTFDIGGVCDLMCKPTNIHELRKILKVTYALKTRPCIIGNGSNILASDKGYHGVIINMKHLNDTKIDGSIIQCNAGAFLPAIAQTAAQNGLTGLEFATGIPGTLGGALYMNAGVGQESIGSLVKSVAALNMAGDIVKLSKESLFFDYRYSDFKKNGLIIYGAQLQLKPGNKGSIIQTMNNLRNNRKSTQPVNAKSAGSVFKNPKGYSAGELIDNAGLKGKKIGSAQISSKHANFIINLGNATATEVRMLMELARKTVWEKYSIKLELEIELLGFEDVIDGGESYGKAYN